MNVINSPDRCIICHRISDSDLTSIHSFVAVEKTDSHNENGIEEISEETQIAFMLNSLSGNDFVSLSIC